MNPKTLYHRLGITPTKLAKFCQAAQITELDLIGSILRDDFRPDSDILVHQVIYQSKSVILA